jgi:prepilin-type N-terminal cleavage/methylation domain-containing protein
MRKRWHEGQQGFTLIEVMIAIGLFVAVAIGIAQLVAMAARATRASRERTTAAILAAAKMDQLRSLAWTYEAEELGMPPVARSDVTTNLSLPNYQDGGPGLGASPAESLRQNTPQYVDYLDEGGRWVGNGLDPPAGAVFIRRWAVRPLPDDPDRTLVLQVLVTTTALDRARPARSWAGRSGSEALLVSVRTRRAP